MMSDAADKKDLESRIFQACSSEESFGPLSRSFLCRSLSVIGPAAPRTVELGSGMEEALEKLREDKIGALAICDRAGRLAGILTERDCVRKVLGRHAALADLKVDQFMTKDPVSESMDCLIAHALNLMSLGGFRHLPIIDADRIPVGIISAKCVMDYLVRSFVTELMSFEIESPLD